MRMDQRTPQAQTDLRALLSEMTETLCRTLGDDLVSVVLFGSQARGDATEGSDWDFLVIARHLAESYFQRHLEIKKALPPAWRARASVLAKTPEEFEAGLPAIYLDVALDGIVLHDTDHYVESRLARLREHLPKIGLYRESNGKDLIWHWEHHPGVDWSIEWEAVL